MAWALSCLYLYKYIYKDKKVHGAVGPSSQEKQMFTLSQKGIDN